MFGPLSYADGRIKSLGALRVFLLEIITLRRARLLRKLEGVRAQMSAALQKSHELARSIAEFEYEKKKREYAISREESFASDFERICSMDGVGKVVVNGNDFEVRIYTKTLTLIHNPGSRTGQELRFDIGQKIIVIKLMPETGAMGYVLFLDGDYKGEYEHGQVKHEAPTCFGKELNPVVQSYITNCEIVPFVHLCLTFLRYEITPPVLRKDFVKPQTPVYEPAHFSGTDRIFQKDAFVEFMRFVAREQLKLIVERRKSDIQQKSEEIDKLEERLRELQASRNFLQQALRGIEVDTRAVEANVGNDLDLLLQSGAVSLRIVRDEKKKLEIDFTLQVPKRDPDRYTVQISTDGIVCLFGLGLSQEHPLASQCTDDGKIIFPKETLALTNTELSNLSIPGLFMCTKQFLERKIREAGGKK